MLNVSPTSSRSSVSNVSCYNSKPFNFSVHMSSQTKFHRIAVEYKLYFLVSSRLC